MPPPKDPKKYALYIERQKLARLGRKFPKISEAKIGKKTWSHNIEKNDPRFVKFQQAGHDACRGKPAWNKNKTKDVDVRLNVHHEGQFKKGFVPWNKNKVGIYSEETLKKIGEKSKGRVVSIETRKKISEKGLGRKQSVEWKNKRKLFKVGHPRLKACQVIYKGIEFKSSWEANIAKKMDELGLFWSYEPKRFEFPHGRFTYVPDFYVFDWATFVEVKGYLDLPSALKIQSFQQYTFRNLLLIDKEHYWLCLNAKSIDEFKNACKAFC
jgi:hypothetical protein